ncbi:MAG: tRNA (N(6)-L-threonylcarbamoyladenosine(37)-C(2))-methylthiotransferase MtaB [Clostridia bacterium]|nr:tRNA (N(6)-L-threonylcarbamoyladenosine(37)-C(2))-methylthiotransferase MtaB [Clostridia bacterium]
MKAAICTLGCKVNQYESQEMLCRLKEAGYGITDVHGDADVYIVNSCTVTAESSRKTRQTVRRLKHEHPDAVVVLTGCYPQAFAQEAAGLEEADIVLGNRSNGELTEKLEEYFAGRRRMAATQSHERDDAYNGGIIDRFEGHTRAFVKIQDGCNRYCSYCIIPKARGFSRSKPLETIRKEVALLAANNYKEIVFVGINLSAYGKDIGLDLCDALETAEKTPGVERIRLGSLEPDHITDDIIDRMRGLTKLCPQFHLSLQSGCDRTLKRMNRHYTAEGYAALCDKLKAAFPDLSLTTDVIAGFPGETGEDFDETVAFVKRIGFMKVHVFPFSPREGTPAFSYPDPVPNAVKEARCARLQKEADALREDFLRGYIGKTVEVLFETAKGTQRHGYTKNYTPVAVASGEELTGTIRQVAVAEVRDGMCTGKLSDG